MRVETEYEATSREREACGWMEPKVRVFRNKGEERHKRRALQADRKSQFL